jgi:hypothetical protein
VATADRTSFAILFIAANNQLQSPLSSAGRDQIAADEDEREQHRGSTTWPVGWDHDPGGVFSGRDATRASSAYDYAENAMIRQARPLWLAFQFLG